MKNIILLFTLLLFLLMLSCSALDLRDGNGPDKTMGNAKGEVTIDSFTSYKDTGKVYFTIKNTGEKTITTSTFNIKLTLDQTPEIDFDNNYKTIEQTVYISQPIVKGSIYKGEKIISLNKRQDGILKESDIEITPISVVASSSSGIENNRKIHFICKNIKQNYNTSTNSYYCEITAELINLLPYTIYSSWTGIFILDSLLNYDAIYSSFYYEANLPLTRECVPRFDENKYWRWFMTTAKVNERKYVYPCNGDVLIDSLSTNSIKTINFGFSVPSLIDGTNTNYFIKGHNTYLKTASGGDYTAEKAECYVKVCDNELLFSWFNTKVYYNVKINFLVKNNNSIKNANDCKISYTITGDDGNSYTGTTSLSISKKGSQNASIDISTSVSRPLNFFTNNNDYKSQLTPPSIKLGEDTEAFYESLSDINVLSGSQKFSD